MGLYLLIIKFELRNEFIPTDPDASGLRQDRHSRQVQKILRILRITITNRNTVFTRSQHGHLRRPR